MYMPKILLTATMAAFALGCTRRSTDCSPLSVCDSISGTNVCGTRELADAGGCTTTYYGPRVTDPVNQGAGSVACNCCPI
ncbi:hypothetical protein LX36DRAFT_431564 [Colletotrichum falcatum]|nr:hypothetical protein LX36DRAFT_431564 [Colletotrichum falcatum]